MDRRDVMIGLSVAGAMAAVDARAANSAKPVPKGFLLGTAISAHQSEGNNINSDMWLNEHVPGTLFREPSGDGIDSYDRYPEDIGLAASLGFNTYRFGIEWARIEPEPGQFSLAALDHYKRMLEACRARGLKPMVTFNHFTVPRWFAMRGGFEVADAPDLFARFCSTAARHFGTLVHSATPINEVNLPLLIPILVPGYDKRRALIERMLAASAKASGSNRFSSWVFAPAAKIVGNTRAAQAKGYAAIKAEASYPVGISLTMQEFQAANGGEERVAGLNQTLYADWFSAEVPSDFIGVQTYTRLLIGSDGPLPVPDGHEKTDAGYEFYPPALGAMVRYAAKVGRKPVIITESGIGTSKDDRRVAFIDATLAEVRRCLDEGIDLRGYIHWSLLDNFEWTAGYSQQFGLVAVDRKTFKRTPKPSAYHLSKIIKSGRI